MKTVSANLATHIASETLTLVNCWKVTRRDGTVLGFADHDEDITFDTVLYKAATGFTPSSIDSQSSLAVDNLDVEGMIESGSITEQDMLAGKYDYAAIEIFLLNYADLTQGKMMLRSGWLGEVELRNKQFVAEIRGLTQALSTQIGDLYSPICRATFGDSRCGYDLATVTVTGSVSSVASNLSFTDSSRSEANGFFALGMLTFTSGANLNIRREVKEFRDGQFTLALPMPFTIAQGDAYSLIRGCDKSFKTCSATYSNALNFRGEPHVPGLDKMLETASTRTG
jgi:uncharacterized phage protein (TIGR02218 family)